MNFGLLVPNRHSSTRGRVEGGMQGLDRFGLSARIALADPHRGPCLCPYFHNGAAGSIESLVAFCIARFWIGITKQEKSDLAAFLEAL